MVTDPDRRSEQRADDLLPEEREAGSDDPAEQAAAIVADADEREEGSRQEGAPVEHRNADGSDRPA